MEHEKVFVYHISDKRLIPQIDFPDSSARKESACNVEDLGSIPGLG